jgi:predicted PurR-regulated permease PerM
MLIQAFSHYGRLELRQARAILEGKRFLLPAKCWNLLFSLNSAETGRPRMEKKRIPDFCAKGELDRLVASIRHQSGIEQSWENQQNTLIERHPYLVGYAFLVGLAVVFSITHLMVFVISFLFLYFISDFMTKDVHRLVPFIPRALLFSVLYILVILSITLITYKVVPLLLKNLPELTSQLQVQIVKEFKAANLKWGLSQYVDIEEIKGAVLKTSTGVLRFMVDSLSPLYKGFIQFVFALAINLFCYLETDKIENTFTRDPNSLMFFVYRFVQVRLRIFYVYFKRVMGGQVIIALINTLISSLVILLLDLPHPFLMMFVVFFCGLFPVVGNLISNSVLIINAFVSIGVWGSGVCLLLLISVHKLEYFLNSKIIGGIVRLPMAVSLGALIFCEVLLGIPGLILAIPLMLFVRHEFENIPGLSRKFPEQADSPDSEVFAECVEDSSQPSRAFSRKTG